MMAHILQCPNPTAQAISKWNIKDLSTLLKDLEMDPDTIEDLSKGFNAWQLNQLSPPMLTDAGCLQSFISWDNFSHGFLMINWQIQQNNYYKN